MNVLEPLLIDIATTPDHNDADLKAEFDLVCQFQKRLTQFLKGEISPDELDDWLAQQGINPHEYWAVVDDNLDTVMSQNTVLEEIDRILVRPDGSPLSPVS